MGEGANESQFAELPDGTVVVNSRSFSTGSRQQRVQAISRDGGTTFTRTRFVDELPEPFNGCQGSLLALANGTLLFSHPDPHSNAGIVPEVLKTLGASVNLTGRDHLTVWSSTDGGNSFVPRELVDAGAAGYSSLQRDDPTSSTAAWLLYEQSDREPSSLKNLAAEAFIGALTVLDPDRIVLCRLVL